MNDKAREIGAYNTLFKNPHGLDAPGHGSTAHDLAIIMRYALQNDQFREISAATEKTISWPGRNWDRFLYNQNKLLKEYRGTIAGKTGWTTPAGRCFVGAATNNSQLLISVVLDAPQMWEDSILLLDYGFDHFPLKTLITEKQHLISVPVQKGLSKKVPVLTATTFNYPMAAGEEKMLKYTFSFPDKLSAPVRYGERIGNLEIYLGLEKIADVALTAGENVEKKTIFHSLKEIGQKILSFFEVLSW